MADLLTHVLVVYALLTAASWWVDIDERWIPVAMGGAAIPDLVKIDILIDASRIEALVGIPFEYTPITTLGGVLLIAGAITLAFRQQYWRRAYATLVAGGLFSLLLDGLRVYADGQASPWLYPFSWWRPPTPSLYVSSDPRVLVVGIVVAGIVFAVDRWAQPTTQ